MLSLNGVKTDLQLTLGPFDGFKQLCVFDGHPQLLPDGLQQLTAILPQLERTVVGDIEQTQETLGGHEGDADDLLDSLNLQAILELCEKELAGRSMA